MVPVGVSQKLQQWLHIHASLFEMSSCGFVKGLTSFVCVFFSNCHISTL